ncbi:hypothetical protein [Rahnella sp. AA]|uniref:hypothetical protein n=1 Tax=Rahnella sp. AA TaxID=2057180 RepID=UPI000C332E8F|nr:hypothetical protein [Rahnella sp. AA]
MFGNFLNGKGVIIMDLPKVNKIQISEIDSKNKVKKMLSGVLVTALASTIAPAFAAEGGEFAVPQAQSVEHTQATNNVESAVLLQRSSVDDVVFAAHYSHSSHASHASHYSCTPGKTC